MNRSGDSKRLKEAKLAYRKALRVWGASERAAQIQVGSGERKPETEALLRDARAEKWRALENARIRLMEVETGGADAERPLPDPLERLPTQVGDPVRRKINLVAIAVIVPLGMAALAFVLLSAEKPYSADVAATCLSERGFAVGSPYELAGAQFFVGSDTTSTVSERQFMVSVQDSAADAEEWQEFWDTRASPSFTATSRQGRSVVGWRYRPSADEINAVTECLG